MSPPLKPPNETERPAALQRTGLLDGPAEEHFDRLTRLARRPFDVPIALDVSFCGHTILGDGMFVIPDARCDTRFADNPLVTGEPSIRFYAGRPLQAAPDHAGR